MEVFTPKEVRRLTGITQRQLNYWISTGLIKPDLYMADSHQGVAQLFTFRDLIGLRTIAKLRDAGLSLQQLRKVQENVVEFSKDKVADDVFKNTFLLSRGTDVFLVEGDDIVISLLGRPGMNAIPTFILDMAGTVSELKQKVEKLRDAI